MAWLRALRLGPCQEFWFSAGVQRGYQIDILWKGAFSDRFGACAITWWVACPQPVKELIVNDIAPEVLMHVGSMALIMAAVLFGCLVGCFAGVIYMFTHSLSTESPSDSLSIESPSDSLAIESSLDSLSIEGDVAVTLCFIIQWIYTVVTIEQTIQRNPVIRNGPRFPSTFGQVCVFPVDYCVYWNSWKIFPVVTIGACLVSIYNDLREARKARREPPISRGTDNNDLEALTTTTSDNNDLELRQTYSYIGEHLFTRAAS